VSNQGLLLWKLPLVFLEVIEEPSFIINLKGKKTVVLLIKNYGLLHQLKKKKSTATFRKKKKKPQTII